MIRKKNWYTVHRWLGLAVSLQLLAWSIGGFVFTILDIQDVRGVTDQAANQLNPVRVERIGVSPQAAAAVARDQGCGPSFTRIRLRERLDTTVYEFFEEGEPRCAVDATTASFLPSVSPAEAEAAALADFAHAAAVKSIQLIENEAPNEYRGGLLPAYQVVLDHPREPHIYVSAVTGDVTMRRNSLWRTFDFFWMLHIMDYGERENINHWLLTAMSVLAVLTSVSGLVLWWWRLPRLRSRPVS